MDPIHILRVRGPRYATTVRLLRDPTLAHPVQPAPNTPGLLRRLRNSRLVRLVLYWTFWQTCTLDNLRRLAAWVGQILF